MKNSSLFGSLEPLEPRIAPAVFNVVVGKTGVRIVEEFDPYEDNFSNGLDLTVDSIGMLHIDPDSKSKVRFEGELWGKGKEVVVPWFVGSLTVKSYQVGDQVTLHGAFPGSVSMNLGSGPDQVVVDSASIAGNLTVTGGKPTEAGGVLATTIKDATIHGALKITGVSAYHEVNFAGDITVDGNVDISLGALDDEVNGPFGSFSVGGNFAVRGGGGDDDLELNGGILHVAGNLSMLTGSGSDGAGIDVGQFTVEKNFVIRSVGDKGHAVSQGVSATDISVGGNVLLQSTSYSAYQQLSASGDITIGGDAKFLTGKTNILSLTDENTTVVEARDELHISGKVSVLSASFISEFTMSSPNGSIGGGIKTSKTMVELDMAGTIGGNIDMFGAGFVWIGLRVNEPSSVLSVGKITSTGNSLLFFFLYNVSSSGALKVIGGGDKDEVHLENTTFAAPGLVDLGGGDDKFFIETDAYSLGKTEVNAPLTLRGGSGKDVFTLSGSEPANPLKATAHIVLDGGTGSDRVVLGSTGDYQSQVVRKNI